MMPHVHIRLPLVLKFLLFFLTIFTLVFIVKCIFSWMFILIVTCTSLCYITLLMWDVVRVRAQKINNQIRCLCSVPCLCTEDNSVLSLWNKFQSFFECATTYVSATQSHLVSRCKHLESWWFRSHKIMELSWHFCSQCVCGINVSLIMMQERLQ